MKCFYHNDLDGRCAGSIVAQFENNYNKDDFFEVDYVMALPLDKIQKNERVYFVDYSFKKDTIDVIWQLILEKTNDIIWIDHHTSSLNLEKEIKWVKEIKGIRQDKISGAALTYMFLYNCDLNNIPYHIKLVSDYDCWIYKYEPNTTLFKLGIETESYDVLDDIWKVLFDHPSYHTFNTSDDYKLSIQLLNNLIDRGRLVKNYIDNDNTYYRDHFSYESEIAGHKCLVVNKKTNSWVFGEKYNEYPLVMVWVFDGNRFVYSIFSSNKDIDCSKIAESYGGGGHKVAAGFSSNELLFKKV